jgi:hypothetical protein
MRAIFFLLFLSLGAGAVPAQDFEFDVRHQHILKDCRGKLSFSVAGVEYRTSQVTDSRTWKYSDLRVVKVDSPTEITLVTYDDQKRLLGKDRAFEFTLLEGKVPAELSAFLLSKVSRPMVLAVLPEAGQPAFEVPVKHLETFGGARGMLRIYSDRVVFESSHEDDSRIWRLRDIERFGQPDHLRLQITSRVPRHGGPTEVYNFELIEDIPDGLYDYVWVRLHPSAYYPAAQLDR